MWKTKFYTHTKQQATVLHLLLDQSLSI
jgi:hypothetical protein